MSEQDKTIAGLKTSQENMVAKQASHPETLHAVSEEDSKATIQVVNPEPEKKDRESRDQEAYMKAFGIFSANRYPEAITAFTEFIALFPGSEYAGNAQYWIGECHYTQKEFPMALNAFRTVIDQYPKGKKVPDAMLKVAFSQLNMHEEAAARSTLQKLIDAYPKSPASAKAKERLSRL
jgi:tol-pal system protein YbgF